jgi:hypothetical protein
MRYQHLSPRCCYSMSQVAVHASHYPFSLFLWTYPALSNVTAHNLRANIRLSHTRVWPCVRPRPLSPSQSIKRSPLCHVPLAAVVQKTQHRLFILCPYRPPWLLRLYKYHEPSTQTPTKQTPFRIHSTNIHSISNIIFRGQSLAFPRKHSSPRSSNINTIQGAYQTQTANQTETQRKIVH